jgi:alkaline phosphatase D
MLTTRRRAIAGLSAFALAPACTTGIRGSAAADAPFAFGVASGDPGPSSVVIWTRMNPALGIESLDWAVSERADLTNPAASGRVVVGPERDFTAKALAASLEPGRHYYYGFSSPAGNSPIGRTRTLPAGSPNAIKLAIASCSNYPFGHFNAYDAIGADEQIDFVLHLGDYIYEYAADGWGGDVGSGLGRLHAPLHEIVSLADYRMRHAQYKSDSGSQRMHAAHPLIPIWDDHESTNNPWTGGAQNHQPDTEGDWSLRRAASLRAYYEWMPIREPLPGADPAAYWRHFAFGDLVSLITLETRHTGRSKQIDYAEHLSSMTTARRVQGFRDDVLGDPSRTMLSAAMQGFLTDSLADAVGRERPWKLIGNQIPIAKVHVPSAAAEVIGSSPAFETAMAEELERITQLGRHNLPIYLDTWDGYPAARENFYRRALDAGAGDLLVLTGDSHAFWLNELRTDAGRKMGYEIGTAGITSPGDFERFGAEASVRLDQLIVEHNPEVLWTDNRHRGFVTLELNREAADLRYLSVSSVSTEDYQIAELKRETIRRSDTELERSANQKVEMPGGLLAG